MAPKEKGDAKAPPAAKAPEAGAIKVDPDKLALNKKIYIICGITNTMGLIMTAFLVSLWAEMKNREHRIERPLQKVNRSLEETFKEQQFQATKPMDIAFQMMDVPTNISAAQIRIRKSKEEYRELFNPKLSRSAYGPWQLHGKNHYYFSNERKSWYDAEDFCVSRGAHLASVLNNEEQKYISSQLLHSSWIGLKAVNKGGEWRWSDGSILTKEYWSEDQPSSRKVFRKPNYDCTMISPSATHHNWKDNDCYKLSSWVCKENLEKDKEN